MATGAGKSLVMADLLQEVVATGGRACVAVPKLDLMEQIARLLEEMLPGGCSKIGSSDQRMWSARKGSRNENGQNVATKNTPCWLL